MDITPNDYRECVRAGCGFARTINRWDLREELAQEGAIRLVKDCALFDPLLGTWEQFRNVLVKNGMRDYIRREYRKTRLLRTAMDIGDVARADARADLGDRGRWEREAILTMDLERLWPTNQTKSDILRAVVGGDSCRSVAKSLGRNGRRKVQAVVLAIRARMVARRMKNPEGRFGR